MIKLELSVVLEDSGVDVALFPGIRIPTKDNQNRVVGYKSIVDDKFGNKRAKR